MVKTCTAVARIFAVGLLIALAGSATAQQAYPNKPIRLIVPTAAGGNLDLISRMIAQALTQSLGQTVFVENQAGANGNIGMATIARAPADGHTLGMASAAMLTINPHLYRTTSVDTLTELIPITEVASGPQVLVVFPGLGINNIEELVAYARKNPGKVNAGSAGNGSLGHLSIEMLKLGAGVQMVHIPYKGAAPALVALLAGQLQMNFDPLSTSLPFIKNGRLRALAVTSAKRASALPDIPTAVEAGVHSSSADAWLGLIAPSGVRSEVVQRIQREVAAILASTEIRNKLGELGSEPVGSTPEEFSARIKNDRAKWGDIIRAAGIRIE